MADGKTADAVLRLAIDADIEPVWHGLTTIKARLHTAGLIPGAPMQVRAGSGRHMLVIGAVVGCGPPRNACTVVAR